MRRHGRSVSPALRISALPQHNPRQMDGVAGARHSPSPALQSLAPRAPHLALFWPSANLSPRPRCQDWALLEPHLDVSIAERLGVSTSPRQAAASACRTTTRSSELETALATRQSLVARRPLLKANTAPEFAFACVGRTNAAAPRNGTPSTRAPGARGLQVEPQGGGGECIPIRRERDEARGGAARTSPGSRGETHVLTSF